MNNNRIVKKPRVKGIKEEHRFWCFYHKRFFDEEKKTTHCIPKACFEFDRNYYIYRMCTHKDEDKECSGVEGIGEPVRELAKIKENDSQRLTLRLTESQRRFLKKALGREVKGILINAEIYSTAGFDNDSDLTSHALGFPEYSAPITK